MTGDAGGQSFARIAGLRALANTAAAATALITGPLLARALGVDGRGELAAVLAPLTLAIVLLSTASGEIMAADIATRRRTVAEVFLPSLLITAAFAAILMGVLVALAPVLLGEHPDAKTTLVALSLCLPLVALQVTTRALRQGERRHRRVTREAWASAALRVVLIAGLFVAGGLTVESGAVAVIGGMILPGVLLGGRLPWRWHSAAAGFWEVVRQQLAKSLRSLPGSVASQLNLRLDQVLLVALVNTRQLGLYVVAVSLAEIPVIGTSALRQVLLPEAADRRDQGMVARASRLVVLVGAPLLLAGLVAAGPLLGLLFGSDFEAGERMAQILLVGTWVGAPGGFLTTGLLIAGRPGAASVPAVAGLACTVVLMPLLSLEYGAIGAAWASLAAYTTSTVVAALLFRRVTGIGMREAVVPTPGDVRALLARVRRSRG
ncbi:MAG TPA: oligosaccharide flippase family protein [Solirubrobacteraceae bacterium]|nr:oligosaccharide flippase family protein [Solirubrobacteraceae bacterium]